MPKFKYSAIDQTGKEKKGKVDANTKEEATAQVAAMGLMVTELTATGGGKSSKSGGSKGGGFSFGKVVKSEELTVFTRQLATLLQAGLPLLRALEVMTRQEKNPKFKAVLVGLSDNVRSGNNFSDGLSQNPKVFDHLYVNMVKAGEAGGVLDVVLSRLADFMEKSLRTKKKIQAAMVYPMVVMFVAVLIVILLMVVVVPRFQKIFSDMLGGKELPGLTQFVIGISEFLENNILIVIPLLFGLFFGSKLIAKTAFGARKLDWAALNMPKIGELGSKVAISRFTRTFGTLLSSGVPILQALTITRDIVGNSYVTDALDKVHDRVRDGETLSTPLEQTKIFPAMVTSMIDVGEETGELPGMLNRIADNYDEDVDNAVSGITSLIEPAMIVFLALVVGTIVIALFLPIIEIMKNLQS